MVRSAKGDQAARDHHGLVDHRCYRLAEPPFEPPGGHAPAAHPVILGDQSGNFQRLAQVNVTDVARRGFRNRQVPVFQGSAEDGAGVALLS